MVSIETTAGCPFPDRHNQTPSKVTDDPVVAMSEHGNYGLAIDLLTNRTASGATNAGDYELLAYALRSIGRPDAARDSYQKALDIDPDHPRAPNWILHIKECTQAARSGSHVLHPYGMTESRLGKDDVSSADEGMYAWVTDSSGWIKPNGFIPAKTLRDRFMNRFFATATNALTPLGRIVDKVVPERPNSAGRWTRLPLLTRGLLRLADLAHRRDWMMANARFPPGVTEAQKDAGPDFSPNAFSPDGRGNNPDYRNVGGVGTAVPFHGVPKDYRPVDRSKRKNLPAPAALAKDFGYRNGAITEALTASAHAWGHLQLLVHDVFQTALDDAAKHPVPVAPDSEEAAMGIRHVHYRSDAINPEGSAGNGRMNGVTGAWDMSPIYGNSIRELARIRTHPASGKPCPDGKIYLDGMDEDGNGGLFLPVVTNDNGDQVILTGFARNMTMPLEAEHTLYARHHNWVCDVLRARHPEWDDNQIFNIARRVVTMTYVKIHTAPWTDALFAHPSVVQGLHANIFGRREWKKPVNQQRMYNPRGGTHPIADGLVSNQELEYQVPEAKGSNFNDAYRFGHTIVPDIHYFPPIGEQTVKGRTEAINLRDLRGLDGHRFLKERSLGFAYHGLMNTRLGAPVAGNYADFFRRLDTEEGMVDLFEAEIVKDRQRGAPAYNDYLRSHKLPPLRSFDDLFIDPQAPASRERIEKLQAHYPGGTEDLDTPLGLLLNEFRPEGFAITNPGFQTFVFEATARIAKQAHLTRLWSPEHVGWTAINLVEAMDKEKLLYLHCPELRDYLKNRPNRNTYEYMGTSAATHPREHPLARTLVYGEEDLADVGLGAPWKTEHFDEKAVGTDYLLRLRHVPTDRTFVVDLTEETVRFDRKGDGRIRASGLMSEPVSGVTVQELLAAAKDIRSNHPVPWPGCACSYDGDLVSGWRLTPAEVRTLKLFEGDRKNQGIPARLTDLQIHILIFNLGDDIERMDFSENLQGWTALEESPFRARLMSLASALRFGGRSFSLSVPADHASLTRKRPRKSTGIFDRNGMIDQSKLAEYRVALEALASRTDDGHVTKAAFLAMLQERGAVGFTTRNQWSSFFRLMKRLHSRETITASTFDGLYNGKLLTEAFRLFAGEDVSARLAGHSPGMASTDAKPSAAKGVESRSPSLPEGAFIGKSTRLAGRDRMALLLRRDPSNPGCYYALLCEYTRKRPPLPSFLPDLSQITNWVPRAHVFYVTHAAGDRFDMLPLQVDQSGALAPNAIVQRWNLDINADFMNGAILTREEKDGRAAETIVFDGTRSISTWEKYVPGDFFLSSDPSGGDYFNNKINTVFSKDRSVSFAADHIRGDYDVHEKAPGLFTLTSIRSGQLGAKSAEKKLLVFIDIVNWKPVATTSEALLIDTDDPRNVGFFYQRPEHGMVANIWKLARRRFGSAAPVQRQ